MIILAVVVALAVLGIAYFKYRMVNTPDRKDLERSMDTEVNKAMKSGHFPGIVVGVYKDGRSLIKGYGGVDKQSNRTPDAKTVFQIGSVTKVLTALLLQRLCDEELVSMDATLGGLLGASISLSPAVKDVSLRQLVTHTSGFPRVPRSLLDKASEAAGDDLMLDPYSHIGPEDVFDYLAHAEGKREAGRFEYSNYGMGLLAHVLERVTGDDYESLVREKVLLPLGMQDTSITLTPEMRENLAQGHTAKGQPARMWTFSALGGAGAYSSTAEDLITFIRASLEEGNMASQLLRQMREPQFKGDSGIGWIQPSLFDRFIGNKTVVWHNGMVGGYASYLAIDDKTGTGVVVLSNQASAVDMLSTMLMRQARTQSWAGPIAKV